MRDNISVKSLKEIALRKVKQLAMNEETTSTVLSDINFCKIYLKDDLLDIALANQKSTLHILKNHADIFTPQNLIDIGKKFHGAAMYINFEDGLRTKIDPAIWTSVMERYNSTIRFNNNSQMKHQNGIFKTVGLF